MLDVTAAILPKTADLRRYSERQGAHTDCYMIAVPNRVELEQFIAVFFDTWIFKLERKLLGVFAGQPSTSRDVAELAAERTTTLALWTVEGRDDKQILLAVGTGPIRTWLMCEPYSNGTRLYFGCAVLPLSTGRDGTPQLGFAFKAGLWFHIVYSKILLKSAARAVR